LGYLEGVGEAGISDVHIVFPSQCEVINTPQQLGSGTRRQDKADDQMDCPA